MPLNLLVIFFLLPLLLIFSSSANVVKLKSSPEQLIMACFRSRLKSNANQKPSSKISCVPISELRNVKMRWERELPVPPRPYEEVLNPSVTEAEVGASDIELMNFEDLPEETQLFSSDRIQEGDEGLGGAEPEIENLFQHDLEAEVSSTVRSRSNIRGMAEAEEDEYEDYVEPDEEHQFRFRSKRLRWFSSTPEIGGGTEHQEMLESGDWLPAHEAKMAEEREEEEGRLSRHCAPPRSTPYPTSPTRPYSTTPVRWTH